MEATVLDLFAGTGALSFEALSRGAERAVAVEKDRRAARAIIDTAFRLGVQEKIRVLKLDLLKDPAAAAQRICLVHTGPFDIIFIDPPYQAIDELPPLLGELAERGILGPTTLIAIEHATKHPPQELPQLDRIARYRYGDTTLALLRHQCRGEEVS